MLEIRLNNKQYEYNPKNKLGNGGYGIVYLGNDKSTNNQVAIKFINYDNENDLSSYMNEITIMQKLSSVEIHYRKFFLEMYDHYVDKDKNVIVIILEYCNLCDLQRYLNTNKELEEKKALMLISQIVYGLKILSSLNIMHRDLKPSNIMLHIHNNTDQLQVKLIDFGCSKKTKFINNEFSLVGEEEEFKALMKTYAGTPLYMSPQLLKKQAYTSKSDIWSLGIILYQMLFNMYPWKANTQVKYEEILDKNVPLSFPTYINPISKESKDFIIKCLEYEEKDRLNWMELFNCSLLKKYFDAIENEINKIKEQTIKQSRNIKDPNNQNQLKRSVFRIISETDSINEEKKKGKLKVLSVEYLPKQEITEKQLKLSERETDMGSLNLHLEISSGSKTVGRESCQIFQYQLLLLF